MVNSPGSGDIALVFSAGVHSTSISRVNLQTRCYDNDRMFKWDVFYLSFQRLRMSSRWHPVPGPMCRADKRGGPGGLCEHESIAPPTLLEKVNAPFSELLMLNWGF